jgi:hypothetical protein
MIYRVHYWDGCESSQGYEYFGDEKTAARAKNKYNNEAGYKDREAIIDLHETPKTKQEMLQLLNMWAGHANNG